jgi:phosphoribosyl-dephospho-CoA transferase
VTHGAFARHELVWFPASAARLSDESDRAQLQLWCAAGRPAIVRSAGPCDDVDRIALGIPLPLQHGCRRISLSIDPASVLFRDELPDLETCWPWSPPAWQAGLRAVASRAADLGVDIRVHGSLGWQVLTNEVYLRAESDIDLLLRTPRDLAPAELGALLRHLDASTAPRFDGEIAVDGGGTTAWRELLGDAPIVLVKRARSVDLVARAALGVTCA